MDFELPVLAPSILAANFTRLGDDITQALEGGAEWIHCDIMDGHFVPNISYGPTIVKQVRTLAEEAFLDVHLMIENPAEYVEQFVNSGADLISVHVEADRHLHRTIQKIKSYGIMAGVVLNPATPLSAIEPILEYIDLVLVMSVNPGFGGQSFIEASHERIQKLTELRAEKGYGFLIEIDGGVNLKNLSEIRDSGADVLVAGTSVFKAENITARVQEILSILRN